MRRSNSGHVLIKITLVNGQLFTLNEFGESYIVFVVWKEQGYNVDLLLAAIEGAL